MIEGPRGATPDELDELCELVGKVFNWQMRENFPTLFNKENVNNLRIIKVDGKIVSHIGIVVRDMIINGCRISVGNIGAVCTDEDYRQRGYAWAILDDAIEKYRNDGVDMFLISGGRGLYTKHGSTHVGKVNNYVIYRGTPLPKVKVKSSKYSVDDLPVWSAIYRNEPIRFHRPYNDFLSLTTSGIVHRPNKKLFSIHDGTSIIAYAVADSHRRDDIDSLILYEYAGSRKAIFGAIPHWFDELDIDRCVVPVNIFDLEFNRIFQSIGLSPDLGATDGTIMIINFPKLCEKMRPLFAEKIGTPIADKIRFFEKDRNYIIALDNDEMIVSDPHDLVRIIFGDPPIIEKPTEIRAKDELCNVISSIFPIPRPQYGLSFI